MDEPGTDVHFKSGFIGDFEQAIRKAFETKTTLTSELLLANGWIEKPGIVVLKNPVIRLGWVLSDKTFIIGYGQLPHPVTTVEQLLDIYRVCGLDELADNFHGINETPGNGPISGV